MHILANRPGRAAYVVDAFDLPMTLRIDGWGGFLGFRAIITSASVQREGNFQVLPSFDDLSYVYVFGDKVTQLRLSGLAFPDSCGRAGGPTGIEYVLEFYERNRAAVRGRPSVIQIGTAPSGHFRGVLAGLQAEVANPEARVCRFTLTYVVMPRKL